MHYMHIRTYKHRWTAKTQGDMLLYTALSHNTVYLSIPFSPNCMPSQVRASPTSPSFINSSAPLSLPYPPLSPSHQSSRSSPIITQPLPRVLPPLNHHSAPPTSPVRHPPLSPSHQPLPLLTCHLAPPTSSFLSSPVT